MIFEKHVTSGVFLLDNFILNIWILYNVLLNVLEREKENKKPLVTT